MIEHVHEQIGTVCQLLIVLTLCWPRHISVHWYSCFVINFALDCRELVIAEVLPLPQTQRCLAGWIHCKLENVD